MLGWQLSATQAQPFELVAHMEHQQHGAMPGTDTSTTTVHTLYEHPDGHLIGFDDNTLICIGDHDTVFIPIGPMGLIELGLKMMAVGTTTEALAALKLAASPSVGGSH